MRFRIFLIALLVTTPALGKDIGDTTVKGTLTATQGVNVPTGQTYKINGQEFIPNLASPGVIGGTTPAAATFTSVTAATITTPVPNGSTGELQLQEDPANGADTTGFKAPASVTGAVIYILPAADGSAGQCLKTNGSGVLSWGACSP